MPSDISIIPFDLPNGMPRNSISIPMSIKCSLIQLYFSFIAMPSTLLTIIRLLYFAYRLNVGITSFFNFNVLKNSFSPNTPTMSSNGMSGYTSLKSHLPISWGLTLRLYLLLMMRTTLSTDAVIVSSKSIYIFICLSCPYCINNFHLKLQLI